MQALQLEMEIEHDRAVRQREVVEVGGAARRSDCNEARGRILLCWS